ncbi:AI-2E family transporter [Sphingomonas cavernae]|uniref:AI-2E family transporter n=1 Tax=Sphingomonas cavernae TaxID=2320861 RepID=A0A418WQM8_9SPHN|nr:AI-2E family transporter [Sphingomonas cavernae]RJF93557.1 AI-2E family transporter [Sphingomonas cavernae]
MAREENRTVTTPGPSEVQDPAARAEIKRAFIWFSMAGAFALVILLIQPLLLILGGVIFAVILDGGTRLLGRSLPIGRGWRLLIVVVAAVAFLFGTLYMTGVEIAQQAGQLRATIEVQGDRFLAWLTTTGLMPGTEDVKTLARELFGSIGRLTSVLGSAFGALTSLFMIAVIGLFLAMEPRIYERGFQWLLPADKRREAKITLDRMGFTMRRLMAGRLFGMFFEGVLTWIALSIAGVPMALILGILTGVLAFIPNIGAFISGLLMVAVGFSAGIETGLAAIIVYFVVQTFDGYVLIPLVARKTVDMPPALTLGTQILFGTLFGIFGLALADPIVAMIKVALERRSERGADEATAA